MASVKCGVTAQAVIHHYHRSETGITIINVNPKYLDINYNACASIDREKLLIPGADHTMSASTDPDRYWRRVNSFVKRVFGL